MTFRPMASAPGARAADLASVHASWLQVTARTPQDVGAYLLELQRWRQRHDGDAPRLRARRTHRLRAAAGVRDGALRDRDRIGDGDELVRGRLGVREDAGDRLRDAVPEVGPHPARRHVDQQGEKQREGEHRAAGTPPAAIRRVEHRKRSSGRGGVAAAPLRDPQGIFTG